RGCIYNSIAAPRCHVCSWLKGDISPPLPRQSLLSLQPYKLSAGRFKERVTWDGNIERNDVSILLCVASAPQGEGESADLRALEQGRHVGQCPSLGSFHLMLSVPWQEEMVFYYYSNRSIPVGRFRERAQWQGDTSRWDGSIELQDVRVNDSGTYVCEIRLLQRSSIFKNHTVLHVSPTGQRGRCPVMDPAALGDSGLWPVLWVYGAEQSTSLQPSCTALPAKHQPDVPQAGLELREPEGSSARERRCPQPGACSCCPLLSCCPGQTPLCSQTSWAPSVPVAGTAWPRHVAKGSQCPRRGRAGTGGAGDASCRR
uniref:Immunoglobulin V-set domain-containing protein n=1 Tax=Strix occidentalis caurina TaxID=311401 RepID=A0A8D0EJG5_STROC